MARDQLASLVREYLEARLDEVEERLAVSLPAADDAGRDVWIDELAEKLQAIELQLMYGDYSQTEAEAQQLLPNAGEVANVILSRRLLEAKFDALKAELDGLNGRPIRRARIVARVVPEAPEAPPRSTLRVSKLCRDYMTTTGTAQSWTSKTLSYSEQAANLLIDFLDDISVGEITRQAMTDAYLLLPRMPAHYTKRYPKATPKATIEAADKANNTDRYSPKTCNLRLEVWKSIFKYAVLHDHIGKSPADHLKKFSEGRGQDARDAFTDEQLAVFFRFLKAEMNERPEHYGIVRVMAYTGMRLEEAAAIRPCDVREVDGVWCIEVSEEASNTKTENAARLVPIHTVLLPELRALVLANQGAPRANLWGLKRDTQGKFSGPLSKRLNQRLRRAIRDKSSRLVVESLRNTFATRLKAADVQEYVISELLGHAVGSLAVGRYGKKLDARNLFTQIEKLSLPVS